MRETVRIRSLERAYCMSVVSAVETDHAGAYERAYEASWAEVLRFAIAWTNDWAAAEDLAQEAFLRLWSVRRTFDWSRSPRSWLLVTTRRLATDRIRTLRRRLGSFRVEASIDGSARERWLDVQASLGRLSRAERLAIVLTTIDGLTYAEAAELLETSPGAVRAAVSRARAKLEEA